MKRYIFLAIAVAITLLGVHTVYATDPPDSLTQEAQDRYDALPADVQSEIDHAMEVVPSEDWEQLIDVTAELYSQNTNDYLMSSAGCAVNSSLWRSHMTNRVYGSTLASCPQNTTWMAASIKLTNPSNVSSYSYRHRTNVSAVMATTSQSYQSGRWRTYGIGYFPHWTGYAGRNRTL